MADFSLLSYGTKVINRDGKRGRIVKSIPIRAGSCCPIKVCFYDNTFDTYTTDGRSAPFSLDPDLFTVEEYNAKTATPLNYDVVAQTGTVLLSHDQPSVPTDTKVWVKDTANDVWRPRHFARWQGNQIYVYANGRTSHTQERNEVGSIPYDIYSMDDPSIISWRKAEWPKDAAHPPKRCRDVGSHAEGRLIGYDGETWYTSIGHLSECEVEE